MKGFKVLLIGLLVCSNAQARYEDQFEGVLSVKEVFELCRDLVKKGEYDSIAYCNDYHLMQRRYKIIDQTPERCRYKAPVGMFRGMVGCR